MKRYRTEILIPPDRYVGLQLPSHLPVGRAMVTVTIVEPEATEVSAWPDADPDHQDIEWWDEFEDAEPDDSSGSRSPSGSRLL